MSTLLLCAGMTLMPAQAQQVLSQPDPDLYGSGTAQVLLHQPDGRVLVGGRMQQAAGMPVRYLARYEASGNLDASWTPQLAAPVTAMALDSVGLLYVVHRPTDFVVGTAVDFQFIRRVDIGGDGSLDPDFLPSPPSGTIDVGDVMLLDEAGGGLYVSHPLTNGAVHIVARYRLDDGSLDEGFVLQANGAIRALALANGALIVGGSFSTINNQFRRGLARLNPLSGLVDDSWDPTASSTDFINFVTSLLVAGEHVFVGGGFRNYGGGNNRGLARISLIDGLADPAWSTPITGSVSGLARDSQGRLVTSGALQNIGGTNWPHALARFLVSGQHDAVWNDLAALPSWQIRRPLVLPGDDVLAIYPDQGDRPARVKRHAAANGLAEDFSGALFGIAEVRRALPVDGGTVLMADLAMVDGISGAGAARIDDDGAATIDWQSTWGADLRSAFTRDAAIGGDYLYIAGTATRNDGIRVPARRLSLADGSLDPSWVPDIETEGQSIAFDPGADKIYIAAHLTGGSPLSRHNSGDGAPDIGWTPPVLNGMAPLQMEVAGEHLYVGGLFNTSDGSVPRGLARFPLDGAGEADGSWVPSPTPFDNVAFAVDLESGWVFAADSRGRLYRYRVSDGVRDPTWTPLAGRWASVSRLAFDADTGVLIVVGSLQLGCDGAYLPAIRMHSRANRIDSRWRVTDDAQGEIHDAVPQQDGSVLLVGRFETVNGVPRRSVARLSAGDSIFADGLGDHGRECVR